MDKYEYLNKMLTLNVVDYEKSMSEFLNSYGKEGWELVSVKTSGKFIDSPVGYSKHWFIFKRKIMDK